MAPRVGGLDMAETIGVLAYDAPTVLISSVSLFQLLDSLSNFVAPAFFTALVLGVTTRLLTKRRTGARRFWTQTGINFVAGVVVLVAGLVIYGRDGVMWTYAVLVLVCGTGQWLLAGATRR